MPTETAHHDNQRVLMSELREAARRYWKNNGRRKPTLEQVVEEALRRAIAISEDTERAERRGHSQVMLGGSSSRTITYHSQDVTRAQVVRDVFESLIQGGDQHLRKKVMIQRALGLSEKRVAEMFDLPQTKVADLMQGCIQQLTGQLRPLIERVDGVKTGRRKTQSRAMAA